MPDGWRRRSPNHLNLLGGLGFSSPHVEHLVAGHVQSTTSIAAGGGDPIAHAIFNAITFAVGALVTYAAHHKWLSGSIKWAELSGLTLPAGLSSALGDAGGPPRSDSDVAAEPFSGTQTSAPGASVSFQTPPVDVSAAPLFVPPESAVTPDLPSPDKPSEPDPAAVAAKPREQLTAANPHPVASRMHTSQRGLALIQSFEGFSARPYDDGTGVMTIGYGTTAADVNPLPLHLTQAQATALLELKIAQKYEPSVNGLGVSLNPNQFDALVSFVYNLGPGAMAWDVGRYTRARQWQAAADAMLQYDHAGGQRLLGLTKRRQAERALYLTPAGPPPPPPDPYQYHRYSDHPFRVGRCVLYERPTVKALDYELARPLGGDRARVQVLRHHVRLLRDRISNVVRWEHPVGRQVSYPAHGWLPPGAHLDAQRDDQGKDFVTNWRGPIQAPGDGECLNVLSDRPFPSGFGPAYPIVRIDTGDFKGHEFYVGHTTAAVRAGDLFKFGRALSHADQGHNFEGTNGGWVELGEAFGGLPGPNASTHWFDGLLRAPLVLGNLVLRRPDGMSTTGDGVGGSSMSACTAR